jgi:two-component system NarL family sensor kinase
MALPPLSVARMQTLAGQLIVAQESERERLAGELHDGVAQQIAGLSLELSSLRRSIAHHDQASVEESLTTLQRQTMGLADAISRLALALRPGLEQFGLVAALERLCGEVQGQHGLEVTLDAPRDFTPFALDIARCFFRGAQEALRNVVKHAGAESAHVVLSHGDGQWTLAITDDGRGFDVAGTRPCSDGLGLFVVEARARLVGGGAHVESVPGRGTTVRIVVPVTT